MKNIAIVVNTLMVGGAEKQALLLARVLSKHFMVTLVVVNGEMIEDKMRTLLPDNLANVQFMRGNWLLRILSLYRIMRDSRIDIIFSYLALPNLLSCLVGKIARIKTVYTGVRNTSLPLHKKYMEMLLANYCATKTIFNSNASKIEVLGGRGCKGIVLDNCIEYIPSYTERPTRSCVTIITVARFVAQKDYASAIKAVAQLEERGLEFKYIIAGYGPLEQKILNEISKHNLSNRVLIINNPQNVLALLDSADIYLSTSLFEGLSNSILEAMSSSLPIVATNVGDNNRLVQPGVNGYLHQVGDHSSIAQSLESLVCNSKMRMDFGKMSHEIVSQQFTIDTFEANYMRLLQS